MSERDSNEDYHVLADIEWEEYSSDIIKLLDGVSPEYIHQGPTFVVNTKGGERLTCETCYYNFAYGETFDHTVPIGPFEGKIKHFLLAKKDDGKIVGMRVSRAFFVRTANKFDVYSKIIVRYRGQGFASAVEVAFAQALQWLADTNGCNIVEHANNQNLLDLHDFRLAVNVGDGDPVILAQLEEEQKRWQALYGDGGKLGFEKQKRCFKPQQS